MGGKVVPRDLTPFMKAFRNFLLGRKHTPALRFAPFLAARTQPQPQLPDGATHKHSDNYYYARDARREVKPPLVIDPQKLISATKEGENVAVNKKRTPGTVFLWDKHPRWEH